MAVWRMANTPVNPRSSAMWSLASGDTVGPTTVAPGGANRSRRVGPLTCGAKTTPPPGGPPFPSSLPSGATHPRHRRRAGLPDGATRPRHLCPASLQHGATHPRHRRQAGLPDGATPPQVGPPDGATPPRHPCPASLQHGATRPRHLCPACLTSGTARRQPRTGSSQASGRGRDTAHYTHSTDRRTALTRLSRGFVPCPQVDLECPA
jgi:hypothetical protein